MGSHKSAGLYASHATPGVFDMHSSQQCGPLPQQPATTPVNEECRASHDAYAEQAGTDSHSVGGCDQRQPAISACEKGVLARTAGHETSRFFVRAHSLMPFWMTTMICKKKSRQPDLPCIG
eukprot:1114738-Karenia_brevis.AAC.1